MSHSAPPVPPDPRSPGPNAAAGEDANTESARTAAEAGQEGVHDRRDEVTNVKDGQPGDAGVNTSQQGRYGGIKQNVTHQGLQQDR